MAVNISLLILFIVTRVRVPEQVQEIDQEKLALNDIQLTKILLDMPAPIMSAQSWAVYDAKQDCFLFGKLERERREIASLTKIMTC